MKTRLSAVPMCTRLGVAVCVALAANSASAQNKAAAEPQNEVAKNPHAHHVMLEHVVVTATPVSPLTFELDPKVPRQPVPASDGADYLKTVPGFNAIRNGGTNGDPVLRGMHGSRLNLLTNEGSMPGGCPGRMDNPLSYVSPETFDQLVVIKGPQSVKWGPGASAGTILFDRLGTRMIDTPFIGSGSAMTASFGRYDGVVDVAFGNKDVFVRTTANHSRSNDYKDGNGNVVASAWEKWNADVSIGYTPDDDTVIQFNAGTGDGEAKYAGRGMDGKQFKRQHLSLQMRTKNLAGVLDGMEATVYYNRADHIMDNYSLRTPNPASMMPMPIYANVDRTTTGGRVALNWRLGNVALATGGDFSRSVHRGRSGSATIAPKDRPWVEDARIGNTGLFLEGEWAATDAMKLAFGARADRATVQDSRTATGSGMAMPMPMPGMAVAAKQRTADLTSGFLRIEHSLTQQLQWYAGLGHVERMPDYWELFSPNMGPAGSANAFSAIRPEKTTQLDMGVAYRVATVNLWANAYLGRIHDYIQFTNIPMGMMAGSRAANIDARVHGVEAGGTWRFAPNWKTEGSLAYAWGQNVSESRPLGQITPAEARWSMAYETTLWGVSLLGRGVRGQHRVATGQGNVVGRDLGTSAGFSTWALSASWHFSDTLMLTAGVDNLFNRAYSEHLNRSGSVDFGYPADPVRINEPGRTLWLKLSWR